MELVVLGSGTSHGIPVIACACRVCRSSDPRDARYRSSLLVRGARGERILVDAGPEFRLQAIRAGIDRLDALFLTHAHADHLHGLDDVRPLTGGRPLPVYGNAATIDECRERFAYVFKETQKGGGKPNIVPVPVDAEAADGGAVGVGGIVARPIRVKHGRLDILGWRFEEEGKAAAYLTDASHLTAASRPLLAGLRVLVVGALRERAHETHFNFDQALRTIEEAAPGEAYLTHLCHDTAHEDIRAFIAARERENGRSYRTEPAWDGLTLPI